MFRESLWRGREGERETNRQTETETETETESLIGFQDQCSNGFTNSISRNGYPDAQYLGRVKQQLADLGIHKETNVPVSSPLHCCHSSIVVSYRNILQSRHVVLVTQYFLLRLRDKVCVTIQKNAAQEPTSEQESYLICEQILDLLFLASLPCARFLTNLPCAHVYQNALEFCFR